MSERITNLAGRASNDQGRGTADIALEELVALIRELEKSQEAGLSVLAQRQAQHGARRRAVAERLAAYLPDDDPQLVRARWAERQAQDLELAARQRLKRMEGQPEPGPDDWVVAGHVSYADGTPATGLRVRLSDPEHKYDDLLAATSTNSFGDFALVQDLCQLREKIGAPRPDAASGKELPEFRLLVADKQGRQLVETPVPVRCEGGCVEYLEILLPAEQRSRKA